MTDDLEETQDTTEGVVTPDNAEGDVALADLPDDVPVGHPDKED